MGFDFKDLIVLDMANNHQGDLTHGIRIIEELSRVVVDYDLQFCIKFQFRQLNSFIHKDFKDKKDIPHIPRFIETELDKGSAKTGEFAKDQFYNRLYSIR